jgi:hypothetical protein
MHRAAPGPGQFIEGHSVAVDGPCCEAFRRVRQFAYEVYERLLSRRLRDR